MIPTSNEHQKTTSTSGGKKVPIPVKWVPPKKLIGQDDPLYMAAYSSIRPK